MGYRLTKLQIKRLLEDKPLIDSRGRKFLASKEVKDALKIIDDHNLYDKYEVIVENGGIDIREK